LDPNTAGGQLPPARSALTARLVLAGFGFVVSAVGAVVMALAGVPFGYVAFFAVIALIAVIDFIVVARRKSHGEPG
jgi:hypothetical protein